METSFLTVKGGPKSSDPTTGIIVIAVVCCVVGTSLGKSVLIPESPLLENLGLVVYTLSTERAAPN